MGILQAPQVLPGQVGVIGAIKYMVTTDSAATIQVAGYLNSIDLAVNPILASDILGVTYSYNQNTGHGSFSLFGVSISNGVITLTIIATTGVTLPTIANHIAIYTNTSGTLSEDAATAINGGNIQAGLSGTAGTLASFPATVTTGSLKLVAVANSGNFTTTISNAAQAQATVYTFNDIGASTGGIPVSTAPFVMKQVAAAAAAGGAAAQSFTDAFCSSGSNVIGNWNTQANAVSVLKIVPGNGSFVVTSSGDAGVGTFNYVIMK